MLAFKLLTLWFVIIILDSVGNPNPNPILGTTSLGEKSIAQMAEGCGHREIRQFPPESQTGRHMVDPCRTLVTSSY